MSVCTNSDVRVDEQQKKQISCSSLQFVIGVNNIMASPIPQTPPAAAAAVAVSPAVAGSAAPAATTSTIIDLDSIPGQIGNAIIRASDGTILRAPTGSLTEQDVMIVYRMMLEIGTVLEGGTGGKDDNNNTCTEAEGLQRVTVGFKDVSYAVTLGGSDGCLYIVKKKSSL